MNVCKPINELKKEILILFEVWTMRCVTSKCTVYNSRKNIWLKIIALWKYFF